MEQIAIIYTTFLRDQLLYKTVQAIIDMYPSNCRLFIGNQSYQTDEERLRGFSEFSVAINNHAHFPIEYYNLPFDCGLSYARNFLVAKAYLNQCQYSVITADSIFFTQCYNFHQFIPFLESNETYAKVGFNLNQRIAWEFNLELADSFVLQCATEKIDYQGINYKKVDICRNFFIAKTSALIAVPWDNELKLLEHEDHCWRLKLAGYKTFVTDILTANYLSYKPNEYSQYRERMYNEYMNKLKEKYHLTSWIKYGEGVLDEIHRKKG